MSKATTRDEAEEKRKPGKRVPVAVELATAASKGKPRASAPPPSAAALKRDASLNRAIAECAPPAAAGTPDAARMTKSVQRATARPNGLKNTSAERAVTKPRRLSQVVGGPNPPRGAAEIGFIQAAEAHRAGRPNAMVNPPPPRQPNEVAYRQWPESGGKKDIGTVYRRPDGSLDIAPTTQVKVGSPAYIARELAGELGPGGKRGYGTVAAVDARLVNDNGTPRVAKGAFTKTQAKRIQDAGVTLRGVPDLEKNATALADDVKLFEVDGLGPVARETQTNLRIELTQAYGKTAIAGRAGTDAALAVGVTVVIETGAAIVRGERPDMKQVAKRTAVAAGKGVLPSAVDSGIYHGAVRLGGLAPEVAATVARRAVGPIFAVVATVGDIRHEYAACQRGDVSTGGAVVRVGAKAALNAAPLALAPLGPFGIAGGVALSLVGRWLMG